MITVSLKELGLAAFLIVGIIACIYLIFVLKNLNDSLKSFKSILNTNRENIDSTLKGIPVITENLIEISQTAKTELKYVEAALQSVSETVETTAAAANSARYDIFGKLKGIIDLIDTIRRIFFKAKETSSESKQE